MKKMNVFMMLLGGACLCFASLPAEAQITILSYGDSVLTYGAAPESSYRYWLYEDLAKAHYDTNQFLFIGTKEGADNGTPLNSWPQEAYAGDQGWTTIDASSPGNLNTVAGMAPDIVLLDFGANDVESGYDLTNVTEPNLITIIQAFASANPNVAILLAAPTGYKVSPGTSPDEVKIQRSQQSKLAGLIGRIAKAEQEQGINVIEVNLYGGFSPGGDTFDGTHPNPAGEKFIAKKFFNAIQKLKVLPKA